MFTLLNAGFLRPLPGVPEADRLAMMQTPVPCSWFESYRDLGIGQWTAAAFMAPAPFSVAIGGNPQERVIGEVVSPGYFDTLRVSPHLGRLFTPLLDGVGGAPVAVVTERF